MKIWVYFSLLWKRWEHPNKGAFSFFDNQIGVNMDDIFIDMMKDRKTMNFKDWYKLYLDHLKVYAEDPLNEFMLHQAEALYMDAI